MINDVNNPRFLEENLQAFQALIVNELQNSHDRLGKVLIQKPIHEILLELDFENLLKNGGGDLPTIARIILSHSNHLHHPRYMGHQVAVPMLPSSLADLLNGVTNNGMAVYEMGPAATAVEKGMVGWMLQKVGWERNGGGVFTHGGSLANLSCLLAARARAIPESWNQGNPPGWVFLASEAAHYSLARSASILGFGSDSVIKVPVDEQLRIKMDALEKVFYATRSEGKKVLAIVASAGVTATGVFDLLKPIGEFCRKENVWLHVDGAHGASALISPRYRELMDGVALADSLVWDTHKMLGTSTLCGAALFRDKSCLASTFSQNASYLFSEFEQPGEDISKISFECTKAPIALKLFFNLAVLGEKGMATHVETLFDRAQDFYQLIRKTEGFECLCQPQANILCFRYGTDSRMQDSIRQRLVFDGDFYITRATIHGQSYMRMVIMNPLTSADDIRALCQRIRKLAV